MKDVSYTIFGVTCNYNEKFQFQNIKMNIIFIRNVDIASTHHVNCEIQLVKALNNLNHQAKLIGVGRKNKLKGEIILLKSPFHRRKFFIIKLSFFLLIYCTIKKIDVVIVDPQIIFSTIFLLLIKSLFNIKIILDVRSIPVEMNLPWDYRFACRIAGKYFDGASFITVGTKYYIEQLINSEFTKSILFPSAVNPLIFSPKIASNNIPVNIKEKTYEKLVVFYHGSISPNRGLNLILDSINKLKTTFPNIILLSLSNNNNYIREYCYKKNYQLGNHLLLLDIVPYEQVPFYINLADLCIIPLPRIKWWEISSPLKLMEYLSMEKPLILSDIEAHLSVVPRNSEFAVYFNPDDSEDLPKKIEKAVLNLQYLKQNAPKGRKIILEKFTWEIQAKTIESFIKSFNNH